MTVTIQARRARFAVAVLFLCNGAVYANVVPRLPEFKAGLELSNAALGTAIAAGPLGAIGIGLCCGALLRRWGSARVATASSMLIAANLVLICVAPNWVTFAFTLLITGVLDSVADIAMNAHGLRVQRRYGRPILNAFHGIWSVGAVGGGFIGSTAAGLRLPLTVHLPAAALVFAVIAFLASRFLLPGSDDAERVPVASGAPGRVRVPVSLLGKLVVIGMIGALSGTIEDSGASWSALYLHGTVGATPAIAGMAFVSLQAFQTVGRLLGDRVVGRFGERTVARVGGLLAMGGVALALLVPSTGTVILGFGLAGLGIATLIPASMHAADNLVGLRTGVGLTTAAVLTRLGFLFAPPIIGLVADATSLRIGLILLPIAAVAVVVSAGVLEGRQPLRGLGGGQGSPTPAGQNTGKSV